MDSSNRNLGLTGRAAPRPAPPVVTVQQGYELWASTYDRDINPLLALEERTLVPLLPSLKGKTVLDLACGTGRWLNLLLARGARAGVGIDISSAMLEKADAKASLKGRLVRGDCLGLSLRSHTADFAVCSFALGHLPTLTEFAAEVARVMGPQSDFYLTDVHPDGYTRGWRTGFRHKNGSRHIVTFAHSLGSILHAFDSQGFELARTLQPRFSEAEKPIFDRAGREGLFKMACEAPAVLVCHFRRKGPGRPRSEA